MSPGKLLGIDTGRVRIGLAITDPDRKLAFPLETYTRRSLERDAVYFRELVQEEGVVGFVVGLPVHTDGREGPMAGEARSFGAWLTAATGLQVAYWDERFTTVEAESALWQAGLTHKQRRARRDRVAAQMLLRAYLEAGCPDDTGLAHEVE